MELDVPLVVWCEEQIAALLPSLYLARFRGWGMTKFRYTLFCTSSIISPLSITEIYGRMLWMPRQCSKYSSQMCRVTLSYRIATLPAAIETSPSYLRVAGKFTLIMIDLHSRV